MFSLASFAPDFKSTSTLFTGTRPAYLVIVRIRSEFACSPPINWGRMQRFYTA